MGLKLIALFSFVFCGVAHAMSVQQEKELNVEFKTYCEEVSRFVVKNRYTVTCGSSFHHYNARSAINHYHVDHSSQVKIANYNLLHPGSNKNSYKDFGVVAQIMNAYDLVSVQELIPRLGNDMRHNRDLVDLIEKTHNESLGDLYRAPGYILLLNELRKLDPSWALITTPRGEASAPSSVHEMLGFFYRGEKVRPIENEHCAQYSKNEQGPELAEASFACYPLFRPPFFQTDVADAFSRKPFLGSFESGNFNFSVMNAHVIYTSPKDEETMKWITKTAFGQDDYSQVGVGVTKETYARFAEVKLTLEMMQLLAKNYHEQDLIFSADMNLEKKVSYWDTLMADFSKFAIYGDMETSLTPYRYTHGDEETGGLSSNYDHFIMNKAANQGCKRDDKGDVVVTRQSYFEGPADQWMKKYYVAREETGDADEPYRFSSAGEKLLDKRLSEHRDWLEHEMTVVDGEIVPQYDDIDHELEIYKRRIFDEQLNDFTYYKFYRELISDHFPVSISCAN